MIYKELTEKLRNKDFQIIDQKYKRSVVFLDGDKTLPWKIDLTMVERVRRKEPNLNIYISKYYEVKELNYFLKWKKHIDLKVLIGYENLKTGGFRQQNSMIIIYKIFPAIFFSSKQISYYFKASKLYESEKLKMKYL